MTPAFKRWFGHSVVVDDAGKPLRVYHITPGNFSTFRPGGMNPRLSGKAIWLAVDPIRTYAAHNTYDAFVRKKGRVVAQHVMVAVPGDRPVREGTNVMPLYARIERPWYIPLLLAWKKHVEVTENVKWNVEQFQERAKKSGLPATPYYITLDEVKKLKELGFDGVIASDLNGDIVEMIVLSPGQVKSAIGNRGTYSRKHHDILKG